MSSTELDFDTELRAFFRTHLEPLATSECGATAAGADTAFVPYTGQNEEFVSAPAALSGDGLRTLWSHGAAAPLLSLVDPLMHLAEKLKTGATTDAQVSPFVYAMY